MQEWRIISAAVVHQNEVGWYQTCGGYSNEGRIFLLKKSMRSVLWYVIQVRSVKSVKETADVAQFL